MRKPKRTFARKWSIIVLIAGILSTAAMLDAQEEKTVLGVGTNNQLYKRKTLESSWAHISNSGDVISVAVMKNGAVLGVGTNNQLYGRRTLESPWEGIPNSGDVISVAVMKDGSFLGAGTNNQLYKRITLESPWVHIPNSGDVISVAVMKDGSILAAGTNNQLYIRRTLESPWVHIPNSGDVISVAVTEDGSILAAGTNNQLYKRRTLESPWVHIPNSGDVISAASGFIRIADPPLPAPRDTADVTEKDVRLMIARFGPKIYLRNDERHVPDDPEWVLDHGVSLSWGRVENDCSDCYDSFSLTEVQSRPTSSDTLLDDVQAIQDSIRLLPDASKYKYWLNINDTWLAGSLTRAMTLVHVLPHERHSTELQFWFFYPFNGPGRVEICASSGACDDNWLSQAGRHYGDWELVSIVVSNTATELLSVYMSRHSGEEIFHRRKDGTYRSASRPEKRLMIFDPFLNDIYHRHPIIFSAISSHAHYPSVGNHNYKRVFSQDYLLGTASADLFDRTDEGRAFRTYEPGRYQIVSSDLPSFSVVEPKWLDYDGRWGQYEKLSDKIKFGVIPTYTQKEVGKGPTGPKMKKEWTGSFR